MVESNPGAFNPLVQFVQVGLNAVLEQTKKVWYSVLDWIGVAGYKCEVMTKKKMPSVSICRHFSTDRLLGNLCIIQLSGVRI